MTKLSTTKASPKFSFGGRSELSAKPSSPGPGAYMHSSPVQGGKDKFKQSPSHTFGFGPSPRLQKSKSHVPGPGQYEPSMPRNASAANGFGTSTRDNVVLLRSINPGPGQYEHTGAKSMGQEGPKHIIAPRREGRAPNTSPGPGAYSSPAEAMEKASMGSHAQSPRSTFGTSKRVVGQRNPGSPGPGSYDKKDPTNGPKFSMSPKTDRSKSPSVPGPGAYESHHTSFGH